MNLKIFLKKIPGFSNFYFRLINTRLIAIIQYFISKEGFHGDKVLQNFVKKIFSSFPITSFIETGTFLGNSTRYVADLRPKMPVLSCEVKKDFFMISEKRLKKYKNVKLYFGSSPNFLREVLNSKDLGGLPCFFLDAHWYDYWPLEDEIEIITSFCDKAIIIIDDFEIPGKPEFNFNTSNQKICGFDLIESKMNKKNSYQALMPAYSQKDAFLKEKSSLTGYIIIFQNLGKEFKLIANYFPDKYFSKIWKFFS